MLPRFFKANINFVSEPTCFDGVMNQGETSVDCGGPCVGKNSCPDNSQCSSNSDCKSGECQSHVCQGEHLLTEIIRRVLFSVQFQHVSMVCRIKVKQVSIVVDHV
jgi:hypothetical protein